MPNETEIIIVDLGKDYWDTYSQFYLVDDGVTLDPAESIISSELLSCRIDVVSDLIILSASVLTPNDGVHSVLSPEIKILDGKVMWAATGVNAVHSSEASVGVTLSEPAAGVSSVLSGSPRVSTLGTIAPFDSHHSVFSEESRALSFVHANDGVNEIFDTLMGEGAPVVTFTVAPSDTRHQIFTDEGIYISTPDEKYIYPEKCYNYIQDSGVSGLTFRAPIRGIKDGVNVLLSEEIEELGIVFNMTVQGATHKVFSDRVEKDSVKVMGGSHRVTSDHIGGWVDSSFLQVLSAEIGVSPKLYPSNAMHSLPPTTTPRLQVTPTPASCSHAVMTKDFIGVSDCYHTLTSDILAGNKLYRRLNV